MLAAMVALPAMSQNTLVEDCTNLMVIPRQFSAEDKPILHFEQEDGDVYSISLYNDDIEKIDAVDLTNGTFNYTLKYRDNTREIKEINKEELDREYYRELSEYYTFEQFLEEQRLYGEIEVRVENGDTIVFSTYSYGINVSRLFFGYDYFGTKYPMNYILCKNNVLYKVQVQYIATYTEWTVTGEHTEERSCETPVIYLNYINFDGGSSDDNYGFILSQTLFNDDEKFEYIIPKMTLTDISDWSSEVPGNDGNTLTLTYSTLISDYAYPACRGVQVLSSDGTVIYDMDFGNGFEANEYDCQYMTVITIGGKNYLVVEGQTKGDDGYTYCTMFYRIDKQAQSIQQVNSAPIQMKARQKNSTINVQLSNTSTDSQIIMSNPLGVTVAKTFVPAGENVATLKTNVPKGVYNITRFQKGNIVENAKILIK